MVIPAQDALGSPDSGPRPPARVHRATVGSGTVWEAMAGYARAVRVGDRILVSGTTATGPDGADDVVGPGDAAAQARFILDKLERTIGALGGRLRDVVRTRVYVRRLEDWEVVARVHGERFGAIRPANTLVQAGLVGDPYLVEVEAEAVIGAGDALQPPAE
jgi:enamine deaminase RidA (YjgF/YER057c/UK114 family)